VARDQIEFDVCPGGYPRWIEVSASEPDLRVHIYVDLTDVSDGEVLEGVMHVTGQLKEGIDPFETSLRRDSRSAVAPRTSDRPQRRWLA
jgi:hypothetical protein